MRTYVKNLGYRVGVFNPCVCHSESEHVGVFRFGDHFVAFGTRSRTMMFGNELGRELKVKCRGV